MLSLSRAKGQYLVFDFSQMTDEQLLALRENPMAVRIAQGEARLACATVESVKIYRDELLREIAPDIVTTFDALFEAADNTRNQNKHEKQNDQTLTTTVVAAPRVLGTPRSASLAELAEQDRMPRLAPVRDPNAPQRRRLSSMG